MKKILFFFFLFSASLTNAQGVSKNELVGMWHLDRMLQDSVCVFDISDSTVLISQVFAYSKRVKQQLTHKDSLLILEKCRKKNRDMRSVFIQFYKDGTCKNRHVNPGPNGGVTDKIDKGTYVFDKKDQTIEYSGSPKMNVSIARGRLSLAFAVGLMMKPQEVIMEYVKW